MDLYLSDKSKQYYLEAFQEVKNCPDEFWGLDEDIESFLETINKNYHIQPIYSQYKKDVLSTTSYLRFAYTKEVELEILREVIPNLLIRHSLGKRSDLIYTFSEPEKREQTSKKDSKLNLKCMDDANYFFINNIEIQFISDSKEGHMKFWQDISTCLSKINI